MGDVHIYWIWHESLYGSPLNFNTKLQHRDYRHCRTVTLHVLTQCCSCLTHQFCHSLAFHCKQVTLKTATSDGTLKIKYKKMVFIWYVKQETCITEIKFSTRLHPKPLLRVMGQVEYSCPGGILSSDSWSGSSQLVFCLCLKFVQILLRLWLFWGKNRIK